MIKVPHPIAARKREIELRAIEYVSRYRSLLKTYEMWQLMMDVVRTVKYYKEEDKVKCWVPKNIDQLNKWKRFYERHSFHPALEVQIIIHGDI